MPLRKTGPSPSSSIRRRKCLDLVVLADEQLRLVGGALAEQVEGRDTKSLADQRVAIGRPQLGILRKPVNQHIGRSVRRTVQLIADAVRAMRRGTAFNSTWSVFVELKLRANALRVSLELDQCRATVASGRKISAGIPIREACHEASFRQPAAACRRAPRSHPRSRSRGARRRCSTTG